MKCVILAGGYAKRMWPLTKRIPKPMLKVGDKPIIEHIMERLEVLEEIEEIHISTNEKFKRDFERWLEGFKTKKSVKIIAEPTTKEEEKFGSIGALRYLIETEGIDDDLLVIGGDNLFDLDLTEFLNYFLHKKTPVVAFQDVGDVNIVRKRFGTGILDENLRIIGFEEKPENPTSTLASTCIYIFPKETLKMIHKYIEEQNNPDAAGQFIKWLSEKMRVHGFVFNGRWFDIGSFEMWERAKKEFVGKDN